MQKIDKELESALATLDKEKEEALKDLDAQVSSAWISMLPSGSLFQLCQWL
jgi:F0F1-type ATP synthase membrane subunit b/b'